MKLVLTVAVTVSFFSIKTPSFAATQKYPSLVDYREQLVQLIKNVQLSVVPINADLEINQNQQIDLTNFGYGLVIEPDMVIAPSRIVEGSREIWISDQSNIKISGRIIGWDNEHGLSILKMNQSLKNAVLPAFIDQNEAVPAGEPVLILSNSMSAMPAVSFAAVASTRSDGIIQISGNLPIGADGGAVFDFNGRVVGLVYGQISHFSDELNGAPQVSPIETVLVYPIQQIRNAIQNELLRSNTHCVYMGVVVADWPSQLGGAHIRQVLMNSPAATSGLQIGDIILSSNNHKVSKAVDLFHNMQNCYAGETVNLSILRGHQIVTVAVVLDSLPKSVSANSSTSILPNNLEKKEPLNEEFLQMRINTLEKEIDRLRQFLKE
jgi:S1-C subfamily serine protease